MRHSALVRLWVPPLVVLSGILWLEAAVPGLPPLVQGTALWRALGDSAKGQGFGGILSLHALADVGCRLATVLAAIAVAWMLVRATPAAIGNPVHRLTAWAGQISAGRFGLILFLFATVIPLAYFAFVRGFKPRMGDEIAYLFQARLLSLGHMSMPAPESAPSFQIRLVAAGSRWFGQYPPGHPLFLAPAMLAGIPWIVGPVMGGIAAVATWLLGRRLYDERTGRLAGALALASPYFWFMSGSYLSHSTCLAMSCLAALGFVKSIQERRAKNSLVAALGGGVALGLAATVRPLTGAGMALGLLLLGGAWGPTVMVGLRHRIVRIGLRLALLAMSAMAAAAFLPVYNKATTGSGARFGYEVVQRTSHALGFGKRGDLNIDFTPGRALFNTRVRWRWFDGGFTAGQDPIPGGGFFFWPFPAVALPVLLLRRGTLSRADLALGAFVLTLLGVYFFYYYLEICWGPRFLYEAAFALLLLTARGALVAGELAVESGWLSGLAGNRGAASAMTTGLLAPAVLIALLHVALPTGATRERLYDPSTWATRRVDAALSNAMSRAGVSEGLVFIQDAGAYYETAWRRMFVDQNRRIIFALDLGESNSDLIEREGGRYWMARFNNDPLNPDFEVRSASRFLKPGLAR